MPFQLAIGRPGQGKSLYNSKITIALLKRAVKIRKKLKVIRKVAINFHLSPELMEKYKDYIHLYTDLMDLTTMKDFDLVIDEISTYLPSDKWKDTHFEVRRMFAQHRKRGMEIYANTQSYMMLDINARRMLSEVLELRKLVGNRSPSATRPKIKFIWGLIAIYRLDPESLEDDKEKKVISIIPDFLTITKEKIKIYDTTEDIKPASPPPLTHMSRYCPVCKKVETKHY